MRRRNGVRVAGEVNIDLVLRDDSCIAAACAATLYAEDGPQCGLAQVNCNFVAQPTHPLCQTDGRGGLAFPSRSRCDAGHYHQVSLVGIAVRNGIKGNLGLVVPVREHMIGLEAESIGNIGDGLHVASGSPPRLPARPDICL